MAEEHTKYNRYGGFESCDKCAEEHRQLAEWLKELKRLKEQEPCDDCISRQAVLEEIEYELGMINSALDSMTLDFNARERLRQRRGEAREILNSIQTLPSVTPQQKMVQKIGHWTIDGKCNRCGTNAPFWPMATTYYCSEYCPNCGSKMQGSEDECKPLQLWKCKRCEKLIPYEADYCSECADELFEHMEEIHRR